MKKILLVILLFVLLAIIVEAKTGYFSLPYILTKGMYIDRALSYLNKNQLAIETEINRINNRLDKLEKERSK